MKRSLMLSALAALGISPTAFATGTPFHAPQFSVVPFITSNDGSVVAAEWRNALGCLKDDPTYGCPFPDPADPMNLSNTVKDAGNQGLLLSKIAGTLDPSAAGADLKGVRGIQIFELGYDLRKNPMFTPELPAGSHCGLRSARFEVTTKNRQGQLTTTYIAGDGCLVPPAMPVPSTSNVWQRLRWGPPYTDPFAGGICDISTGAGCLPACRVHNPIDPTICEPVNIYGQRVEKIRIMFDEGPDMASGSLENFALAVLDNIDVNGKLVGSGPSKPSYDDEDHGEGEDGGHHCRFRGSQSHPEDSDFEYDDAISGKHVRGVNGARSITYSSGPLGEKCVNMVGDAIVNGSAGYLYNFVACDLWLLGGLGAFSVSVTGGLLGSLPYQQTATMTSGYVSIHDQ